MTVIQIRRTQPGRTRPSRIPWRIVHGGRDDGRLGIHAGRVLLSSVFAGNGQIPLE